MNEINNLSKQRALIIPNELGQMSAVDTAQCVAAAFAGRFQVAVSDFSADNSTFSGDNSTFSRDSSNFYRDGSDFGRDNFERILTSRAVSAVHNEDWKLPVSATSVPGHGTVPSHGTHVPGRRAGADSLHIGISLHIGTAPDRVPERLKERNFRTDKPDIVVTTVAAFDFQARGGDVVQMAADLANEYLAAAIVFALEVNISVREMRTFGIEAAYVVPEHDDLQASLFQTASRIAQGWGVQS